MATVTELVTKFSFMGNLGKLTDFNTNLGKSIKLVAGMAAAVKTTSAAILGFSYNTLQSIEPMINAANAAGIDIERFQGLGYAASMSGSDIESLGRTLTLFGRRVGDASVTGNEYFARLGIRVRDANGQIKSTDDLLLEVGNKIRDLPQSKQLDIASRLGIDKSLIGLITRSRDEIEGLVDEARMLGIVTGEQAKNISRTNDSLTKLRFAANSVQQQIAIGFAPQLEELSNWFVKLLANNKDLIINGLSKFGEFISGLSKSITRLLPVIGLIIGAFVLWKIATIGLGGVLGFVLSPVFLITAGILALLLIVDDLIVAFRGGDSVIRNFFLESFGYDIKPLLEGLDLFLDLVLWIISELISAPSTILKGFIELTESIRLAFEGDFEGAVNNIKNLINNLIDYITSAFSPFFSWISNQFEGILPDWAKNALGFDTTPSEQVTETANQVNDIFSKIVADAQITGSASSGTNVNQTVTNNTNINVSTNNAEQAAKEIGIVVDRGYQRDLKTATDHAGRGGR